MWTRRELGRLLSSTDLAAKLAISSMEPRRMTTTTHPAFGIRWPIARLAAVAAALVVLTAAAGPTLHLAYGGWALMLIFALGGAGILFALRIEDAADQRDVLIVILAGAGWLMRLALLFVEPYLSTDIYRYIWDGRVSGRLQPLSLHS